MLLVPVSPTVLCRRYLQGMASRRAGRRVVVCESIKVPVMRSRDWKRDSKARVDSSCVDMGWNKLSMPNRPMP